MIDFNRGEFSGRFRSCRRGWRRNSWFRSNRRFPIGGIAPLFWRHQLRQIDMAVLGYPDRDVGNRKSNLIKDIGTMKQRTRLKIDEKFLKPNDWGGILLLDFEFRHLERQHKGIELDLLGRHWTMQLIGN